MLIIARTFWFVSVAIRAIIVGVIALMIVRLIADAMDLNPFGWTSRTVNRLSNGFLLPVRGRLREFGVNPNFAPLIVILIVILLGYFVLQLVGDTAATLGGIVVSIQRGELVAVLGFILYGLLSIYILLIFIRIIFSWGMMSYRNRLMRFLVDVTEPLLGPLRRIVPPLGRMDISPIVAFLIVWLLQQAIAGTLLRGASFPNV